MSKDLAERHGDALIDDEAVRQKIFDVIYESALRPEEYCGIFFLLRNVFCGAACGIFHHDIPEGECWIMPSAGFKLRFLSLYQHGYGRKDPWWRSGSFGGGTGAVLNGENLMPPHELVQCDFYENWLKPQGLIHWLAGVLSVEQSSITYFAVLRNRQGIPFGRREKELMRTLLPHLKRSLYVHNEMAKVQMKHEANFEALNYLPLAVFCVDRHGEVLNSNSAGWDMLSLGNGIMLKENKLSAVSPTETAKLRDLVTRAGKGAIHQKDKLVGRVALSREAGFAPLSATVSAVSLSKPPMHDGSPAALVFVSDPACEVQANENWLKSFFGLTPTEAKVAALIADGLCLNEISKRLCIGVGTARTHLKRVFNKTGTSRQAELVRLALSGPAHMVSLQDVPAQAGTFV